LLPYHVKFAWRAKRNRRTGSTLLIIFGFLILTGYRLYYAGDERLRAWTSDSHLYVGLALPLLIALHVWRGKKSRVRKKSRALVAFLYATICCSDPLTPQDTVCY
jgi:uncharacterized membrane protein YbhN (UPF0104 family)